MPADPRRVRTIADLVRAEADRMRRQAQVLAEMPAVAPDAVLRDELDGHGRRCQTVARQLDLLAESIDAHARAVEGPAVRRHLPEIAAVIGVGAAVGAGVYALSRRAK